MTVPKVSIVITAYNAERYIGACVAAALAQTYPNFEVVVVNDGSTDATEGICASIADPRFRYFNLGRMGRCMALNEAVSRATGDYIANNDVDDLSLPHRLEYVMEFFSRHDGVAYAATRFAETLVFLPAPPADLRRPGGLPRKDEGIVWPSRADVFRRNLFNHSTLVYPKSVWKDIGGYDEQLTVSEDYDFYLRALQCGRAALLPGRTVLWYTNPDGFFKHTIRRDDYLRSMTLIKSRAHRLLRLPFWVKLYHHAWVVVWRMVQWALPLLTALGRARHLRRMPSSESS
jgi:glycosyltransferase involved in cell wall biosynthesis